MGVPGFFAWLLRKYKNNNMILQSLPDDVSVDVLYIDANCLFHPQCFKLLASYPEWSDVTWLHNKMIKRILNYITYLKDYTNSKEIFISVDGVAPMAKMNQQRLRRYRSIDDMIAKEERKVKHGKHIPKRWSNTVITPGTEFMEALHTALVAYIKKEKKVKMRYSSYHSDGEGEHKVLADIRARRKTEPESVFTVYGLDADLIFLSLASQKKNMYLLREVTNLGSAGKPNGSFDHEDPVEDVEEDLNYVSIDEMKECLYEQMEKLIKRKLDVDKITFPIASANDIANDFIFVCYFLGNDFLPHIPSVDINIGGLDIVLDAYVDTYSVLQSNIVNAETMDINEIFLEMFLKYMSNREDYYFKKILPKFLESTQRRRCPFSDPHEIEEWKIENMIGVKVDDPIQLGIGDRKSWKHRYYGHHFHVSGDQTDLVDDLSREFLQGVVWTYRYYFEGCCSWSWKFPYPHAPFMSDIFAYVEKKSSSGSLDLSNLKIDDTGPLQPCQQLVAVLPPSCNNIIPVSYRYLVTSDKSSIIEYFPQKIELNMIGKYRYWQCEPKIPQIDPKKLRDATSKLSLNTVEKKRNKVLEEFTNK